MKNIASVISTLLLLLLSTTPVLAQSRINPNKASNQSANQEMVQTRKFDRVQDVSTKIINRLTNHVSLFEKFVTKIETRRSKMNQNGANFDQIDSQLRLVKTEIANVKAKISSLNSDILALEPEADLNLYRSTFKTKVSEIRTDFRSIYSMLATVVRLIGQNAN